MRRRKSGSQRGVSVSSMGPNKASGTRSHTDPVSDVQHSHYFYTASQTISVGVGDTLFAYVLLSACDPPDTVVLQWNE